MNAHVRVKRVHPDVLIVDGVPVDVRDVTAKAARTEARRWDAVAKYLADDERAQPNGTEPMIARDGSLMVASGSPAS